MTQTVRFGGEIHNFPDDFTEEDISAALSGAPAAPEVGVGADVAKSGGIGFAKGLIGLAGLPGDAAGLLNRGIDYGLEKLGLGAPKTLSNLISPSAPTNYDLFGSGQIQRGVESLTGEFYKPQTVAGEYAQTAGEFLPAAATGPGGIARRVAGQALIPAAVSETAGQATKGTALEPYARIAGGLAGGLAGARATAPRATVAPTPTVDQIRAAATAGYQHPEVAAVQIRPQSVERLANQIEADLNRRGQLNVPESAGATHGVVDRLRNTGNTPGLPQGVTSVEELRSTRSALSGMSAEVNQVGRPTSNAVAAGRAMRRIDAYLDGLQQPDLVAGNAQRASRVLRQANQDWAAASKAEDIGTRLTRADRQAAKSGSGSNIDNSIRQKISAVLDVPSRTVGLRPEEIAQAERVVRGSPTGNTLRKVGKLGFNDGLTLMAHAVAALPSGGLSIPIGVAGTIARKIGENMTERNARRLENMILGRSAEAERWRAIQARINAANPVQPANVAQGGLLGGLFGSSEPRASAGILPFDQRWQPIQ